MMIEFKNDVSRNPQSPWWARVFCVGRGSHHAAGSYLSTTQNPASDSRKSLDSPSPAKRESCGARELAVRMCILLAGLALYAFSGGGFIAIRQRCKFACDAPAGLYAAILPPANALVFAALPGSIDSAVNRTIVRAATLCYLLFLWSNQLKTHLANAIRVYNIECPDLYESALACGGSMARNSLGFIIGIAGVAMLAISLARTCFDQPSLQRELAWLWSTFRVVQVSIGMNIMITCPIIAIGDTLYRASIDFQTFLLAGLVFLTVGSVCTPDRREKIDRCLASLT